MVMEGKGVVYDRQKSILLWAGLELLLPSYKFRHTRSFVHPNSSKNLTISFKTTARTCRQSVDSKVEPQPANAFVALTHSNHVTFKDTVPFEELKKKPVYSFCVNN